MKNLTCLFCVCALGCAFFAACDNEPNRTQEDPERSGLGAEIPGIETKQATGTVIGRWADTGYGCIFIDVDEEYPIGEPVDYYYNVDPRYTELSGDYHNVIQVQHNLPNKGSERISFSVREFQVERDRDLFTIGDGIVTMEHTQPSLPQYVITDFKPLND